MPSPSDSPQRLRFGPFEVDLRARELRREGERVALQGKPFEILAALLERSGEVVLREELYQRLWPGRIVEYETNLSTAVAKLRRALGDLADDPDFVETVPGVGYRLLASPVDATVAGRSPAGKPRLSRFLHGRLGAQLAGAAILALLALVVAARTTTVGGGRSAAHSAEEAAPVQPHAAELAILPFSAVDASDREFAELITEETATRIAKALPSHVRVWAGILTEEELAEDLSMDDLERQHGVEYAVEGSVRRVGTRLRLTVRLVDIDNGIQLWTEAFEPRLSKAERMRGMLATEVAEAVAPLVGGSEVSADLAGAWNSESVQRAQSPGGGAGAESRCPYAYRDRGSGRAQPIAADVG